MLAIRPASTIISPPARSDSTSVVPSTRCVRTDIVRWPLAKKTRVPRGRGRTLASRHTTSIDAATALRPAPHCARRDRPNSVSLPRVHVGVEHANAQFPGDLLLVPLVITAGTNVLSTNL